MEQRNGRIDRHGQKANHVQVFHFVSKGYKQRQSTLPMSDLDADLESSGGWRRRSRPSGRISAASARVLADDVEAAMLGRGYNLARTDTAERGSEPVRKMLKFERDLARQIQALWTNTGKPRRNCGCPLPTFRRSWRSGSSSPSSRPSSRSRTRGQADLPVARLARKLGGVCRQGLEHPHTKVDPPDHLRPRRSERAGRLSARPPQSSAGPDEPAAAPG